MSGTPSTYTIGRSPGFLGRLFRRPPGIVVNGIGLIGVVGILYARVAPGGYTFAALCSGLLWLMAGAIWCVRAIGFFICTRGSSKLERRRSGNSVRWVVGPVASMIMLVLLACEAPARLGFIWSRPALEKVVRKAQAAAPFDGMRSTGPTTRAGIYVVSVPHATQEGQVFIAVRGTEFFRSLSGFAYDPTGTPNDPEGSFEPLGGNWYIWHTSW